MTALFRPAIAGLLAALVLVGCGHEGARRPAPREGAPNVLLISIDTLRADRVGAYGASFGATPHLDALAAAGLRAEKALSPVPITLPAHATLLTGLYPPHHGVRHNGIFRLGAEQVTLAERFRDAGYATGAVVGAMVLEARFGLDQGFDRYDDDFGSERANSTGYLERRAPEVTAAALRWLDDVQGPFFLFVHYYDPHADYKPPPELAARFAGRPYEGEIAAVDAAVGELLAGLRSRGVLERTVVAVTADHGESLGEHGEHTHSYTLYDATLSVPLILQGPGVPDGRTLPGVVSTASVAPTLLRLAGLAPFAESDGEDLVARLAAPPADGGKAYAETLATQLDHGWAPLYALRTPEHHFVRAPRPELYAVREDPHELRNLLPGDASREAAALDAAISAQLAGAAPLRSVPVDAETKQQLRSLGYALADAPVAATGLDPKDGLRLVEVYVDARTAFYAGDLERAERRAREMLAASPGSGQAHALLSGIARRRGDLRGALAEAEQAAERLPQSAAFHSEIGDLRVELGDLPGAVAAYEAALAVDAEFAEARAGLMWRAALAKDPGLAAAEAERAVAVRADDPALRLRIAQNFERMGDGERALEAFRETLRLDPSSAAAHMGAAIQLARLGEDRQADEHLAAAGPYASEPNHRNRLAIAYAARGEHARAEALFRDVLAAHPDHPNARRNLAHLLRTTGRAAEAAELESGGGASSSTRSEGASRGSSGVRPS